jgi:hypothetical protein
VAEQALTKPQVIAALTRSPHGQLGAYLSVAQPASREDADFYAHLVAWNARHGQVRDAQVALPVVALSNGFMVADEYVENALACLAALEPRQLVQALDFADGTYWVSEKKLDPKTRKMQTTRRQVVRDAAVRAALRGVPRRLLDRLVERYLRDLEAVRGRWDGVATQHRKALKTLYARYHVKPDAHAARQLFARERSGKFAVVKELAGMSVADAAQAIVEHRLPYLVARGAVGKRATEPDIALALIARMSPTELVTNTKALERMGIKTVPAVRAAYEAALAAAGEKPAKKSGQRATLKASRAAAALQEAGEEKLAGKLHALQERQLDRLGGIDGRWLVLGDKSGSMAQCIQVARTVAATLARMVKGEVHLVFFDSSPRYYQATGLALEQVEQLTRGISASGMTSIGCGLQYAVDKGLEVDGIAVVSDGGHNTAPDFPSAYAKYVKKFGNEPTVYYYHVGAAGDFEHALQRANVDAQVFDLGTSVDFYSIPNIAQTMRVARYSLLDDVLAEPLRTVDDVLARTRGQKVMVRHVVRATV